MSSAAGARRAHGVAMNGALMPWVIAAIALAALAGWVLDISVLTSWWPDRATQKPITALSFLALVLALRAADAGRLKLSARLGWGVVTVAALSLVQNLTGIDLRVDRWLSSTIAVPGPGSGNWRMASASAGMFIIAGTAIAWFDHPRRGWLPPVLAGLVGLYATILWILLMVVDGPAIVESAVGKVALPTVAAALLLAGELLRRRPLDLAALLQRSGVNLGIRGWLLALALASSLPVLVFAGVAAHQVATAERRATLFELEQRTQAMASTVERYLQSVQQIAVTLAISPALLAGDLPTFHGFATRALRANNIAQAVGLVEPGGQFLLNTFEPFGKALPQVGDRRSLAEALARKAPYIGGLITGAVSREHIFGTWVPVIRDGAVTSVLVVAVRPLELTAVLLGTRLPDGWIGAVLDGQGTIVARTHDAETRVGRSAAETLLAARAAAPSGTFAGVTVEGIATSSAFVTLPDSGWTVAVGVPTRLIEGPAVTSQRFMLGLALASLLVAGTLAVMVGRHMSERIDGIARAATLVGGEQKPNTAVLAKATSGVREFDAVSRALAAAHDVIQARETALRENEQRLRIIFDTVGVGIGELEVNGKNRVVNNRLCEMLGYTQEELLRLSAFDITHPDDLAVTREIGGRLLRGDIDAIAYEKRYLHKDGSPVSAALQITTVREGDGRFVYAIAVVQDITARQDAEQHAKRLMYEVDHRAKNLLAVVQAVARQTAAKSTPGEFAERFGERLAGLAASHDLLVGSEWRGVDAGDLARSQFAHFADFIGTRVTFSGPQVQITAAAAQAIGMALHELATNAAKYGALSNATGSVHITWRVAADGGGARFRLSWSEHGGPPVAPPEKRGFGQTVIVDMVKHALGAEVSLAFAASGLIWQIDAPADRVCAREGAVRSIMS